MRDVFRQGKDALSKNPGHASDGRFELDLSVFLTRACGARPSGRLRRSRRKRRNGHFLFKKKVTRAPARKGFRAFAKTHPVATRRAPCIANNLVGSS
jgi:hypothetical protein